MIYDWLKFMRFISLCYSLYERRNRPDATVEDACKIVWKVTQQGTKLGRTT